MQVYGAYLVLTVGLAGLMPNGGFVSETFVATSTVEGAVSYTQGAQTLVSEGTSAGGLNTTIDRFVYGVYVKSGAVGQSPHGYIPLAYGLGGNVGSVSYTQGAQTLVSEGTTGTTGVAGVVNVTQGAQTLVSAGTVATTGTLSRTQGAQTLVSAGTVKSLSLDATGTTGIVGTVTYTQGAQTLVSAGGSGAGGIGGVGYTQGAQTLVSTGTVAITGTVSYTQGAHTLISGLGDIGDRFLSITLRKRNGEPPVAGQYRYAFFEQKTADTLNAPTHRGVTVVNANGACTITLPDSNLAAGGVGYLVLSDSDGDPDTVWLQLSGPVTVS